MTLISIARQRQLQSGLIVAFITQGFVASAIVPRVPDVIAQLDVSFATWGLVSGLAAVGAALGLAVANALIHRWGTGAIATASFGLTLVTFAALGFLHNVWVYFALNCGMSFALNIFVIAINSQAVILQTVTGRVIIGRFHAAWSIGSASSAAISGFLAPYIPLWLHLLLFSTVGGVAFLAIRTRLLSHAEGRIADSGAPERPAPLRLMPKRIYLLGFGLACGVFPEAALWDWSNVYGRTFLGYDPIRASIPYSVFALFMIIGRIAVDSIGKRVSLFTQAAVSALLGSVALIGSTIWGPALASDRSVNGLIGICAFWALAGLGAAPIVPTFLSSASIVSGMSTAQAMARISLLEMWIIIAVKMVMGNVAETDDVGTAFWIPIGSWILASVISVIAGRLARRHATQST